MNFSQGHSGTKVQCESCLLSLGKTPEFTKMGEIHELFVLALSLVWFAGATPETHPIQCASRKHTWKAEFLCVIVGSAITYKLFWGTVGMKIIVTWKMFLGLNL